MESYIDRNHAQSVIQEFFRKEELIFNSHDYIEKFRSRFENEYIGLLVRNQDPANPNSSIKETHGQIAASLKLLQSFLGIRYECHVISTNDPGNYTPVALWKKI